MCGGPTHTPLLDRVESKAFRFINFLSYCHPSQYKVPQRVLPFCFLSTFFLLSGLVKLFHIFPLPSAYDRSTLSHPYFIQSPYDRADYYPYFFSFPLTNPEAANLLLSVLPPTHELNFFKRNASRHPFEIYLSFTHCLFFCQRIAVFVVVVFAIDRSLLL